MDIKKILLSLVLFTGSALAQGGAFGGVPVLYPTGSYVPTASVRVCLTPASGTPCSNLATIYTDATLGTSQANPILLTPQNYGQYSFGAAPANYQVQISGIGLNTYTFPVTFGIPTGGNATFGTLTLTGSPPLVVSSTTPVANLTLTNHVQAYTCGSLGVSGGPCSSGSQFSLPLLTQIQFILSGGGTASATGIPFFLRSMSCTGSDQTAAEPVRIASSFVAGNSSVSAVGTAGDSIYIICLGS